MWVSDFIEPDSLIQTTYSKHVIMATDGRDNVGDYIAGTISEHVINRSRCPVLVVPFRGGWVEGSIGRAGVGGSGRPDDE